MGYCANCKTKTDGFIINFKGNKDFKCIKCKSYTPVTDTPKTNSPIVIFKGKGFHNTDYVK